MIGESIIQCKKNEEDFTAVIVKVVADKSHIFIPRNESANYIITKIGCFAFYKQKSIKNISFDDNSEIRTFEEKAFYLSSLEYISIPRTVERIESECFSECKNLKTVNIQENSNLIYLGESIFNNTSIESLTIPEKLSKISFSLFEGTPKLNSIKISPKNKLFSYYKKEMIIGKNNQNEKVFTNLLFVRRNIEKIIIPSFIKCIKSYAFDSCKKLKSVEFENNSNLSYIGNYAFNNISLKSISFPSGCKHFIYKEFTNFQTIEYLGDTIYCLFEEIFCKSNLLFVSFPNCKYIKISYVSYTKITIYICANAHIDTDIILVWAE